MWKVVSIALQTIVFVVAAPLYFFVWIWGFFFRKEAALEINDFTPKYGKVGSQVTIEGSGLQSATIKFGGEKAQVKAQGASKIVVIVPQKAPGEHSIVAEDGSKKSTAPGKFRVLSSQAFTFRGGLIVHGASILNSITPSSLNQKYLVLMVKPKNIGLPSGATEGGIAASLQTKLEEASKFWLEASYGRTSFTFEITPTILSLEQKSQDYYVSTPTTIDGSGAAYPIMFAGGETLIVNGDGSFSATVTFTAGSKDLGDVVTEINQAFKAVVAEPPIKATTFEDQLRLRTIKPGAGVKLELDQTSTALTMLGLGPDQNSTTVGDDSVDNRWNLIQDSLTQRVVDMSDEDAKAFLKGFSGVLVTVVTNDLQLSWPRATTDQFNVRGEFFEFSAAVLVPGIPWQVMAHEIGHNLGFPDLYDAIGTWPETEPGYWDIMDCSWGDVHPSTWIKNYMTIDPKDETKTWLHSDEIEDLPAPEGNAASTVDVILAPIESPLPTTNPFSASHPDIPLRHAIRIKLDDNRSILVENRQPGGYNHPELGAAKYSTQLAVSAGGIIVTDTINKHPADPIRSNVIMASPYDDTAGDFPDVVGDEVIVIQLSPTSAIKVKILEVIGSAPIVYKVRASWTGSWVDPYITPWAAPPYETPDIWVDTEVDNKWDEYLHKDAAQNPGVPGNPIESGDRLRKDFPARLYARIRNSGKEDAVGVVVKFSKVVPPGIGPTPEIEIGTTTVNVPGNGVAIAKVDWTPIKDDEEHACIKVALADFANELNTSNNVAQENFNDWFITAASPYKPVSFTYQVVNPLPHRALVRMQARGLKPGWFLDVDPLQKWMDPGEKILGFAAVRASQSVPCEDKDAVNGRPRISLLGRVKIGCTMVPFGGISGIAHAVREAKITGKVSFPNDKTASITTANAKTSEGPIGNTNVTVILAAPNEDRLLTTQVKTNAKGDMSVFLDRPDGFPPQTEFTVDLLLSPSPGTSPAETRLKVKYPSTPPVASFSAFPESGIVPLSVQFNDESSGEITSRSWQFGDGAGESGTNPTHTYKFEGTFTVTLSVSGPNGSSTAQKMVTVQTDPLGGGGNKF